MKKGRRSERQRVRWLDEKMRKEGKWMKKKKKKKKEKEPRNP